MIARILFAVKQGWHYRNQLRQFMTHPDLQVNTPLDLDLLSLKNDIGIKVLALDLDGVMVSYGENKLTDPLAAWLSRCVEQWTVANIFIYTNRSSTLRKEYFLQHFPGMRFVEVSRKKPYPDGLYQIIEKTKVLPGEILVIDDRLLTGILAALIVGTKAKWVTKPLISIKKRPVAELLFILLRALERFLLCFL